MWNLLSILTIPAGGLLWFLGGCGEDCNPGLPPLNKSWRRHVWPLVMGIFAFLSGAAWDTSLAILLTAVAVNTLGYGEEKSWAERIAVALTLGLPALWIHTSVLYPIATLATFIPLYYWSLKRNWMSWRVVEACTGCVQAATLFHAVMLG